MHGVFPDIGKFAYGREIKPCFEGSRKRDFRKILFYKKFLGKRLNVIILRIKT